jgi:hypothetical protein
MGLAKPLVVVRVAVFLIVSLLAPPLLPLCAERAPAAHDCCRKPAPARQALKMQPCCVAPDTPGLPATTWTAPPIPRLVTTALPAVAPLSVVALRGSHDLREGATRTGPVHLRHIVLLI